MDHGYLAQESIRMNASARKTQIKAMTAFICLLAVLYFLGRDSLHLNDLSYGTPGFFLAILTGAVVICSAIKLIATGQIAKNGSNLVLPYRETTPEAAAGIIDAEALEGNILVEEYMHKAADEKIVLTPSYLLLCGIKGGPKGTSKVTAIPRDKICWICAQAGQKGGPFIVRLLIFTENKLFSVEGVDIDYVKSIADKLYQYIPNIFSDYDPFSLSYELEKIFAKNPAEFLSLCENEKRKKRD